MRLRTVLIATFAALAVTLGGTATAHGAEWVIKEAPLSALEMESETLSSSGGAFELTVPALSLTIKCTAESGSGKIISGEEVSSTASFELSGCIVSKFEKACSVKSPGKSTGVLTGTATGKFFQTEVKEVERGYERFTPTMTVEISGAECGFSSKLEMSGATAAEVPKLEEEIAKRPQKFSKAIAEESGVTSLKLGANQAFMTGEVKESLGGAYKEEAMGITSVILNPMSLLFTETGFAMGVILKNIGPRKVKVTNIELEAGAFEVDDTIQQCKGKTLAVTAECLFGVTCITLPSAGQLVVEWDVLNDNGKVVGFAKRRMVLGCGVA
jgi:hypothetical protein